MYSNEKEREKEVLIWESTMNLRDKQKRRKDTAIIRNPKFLFIAKTNKQKTYIYSMIVVRVVK